MDKRILPTPEQLRELLRYDPDTGKLFWKPRSIAYFNDKHCPARQISTWNARFLGKEAFTSKNQCGYRSTVFLGYSMLAHRVAWAIVKGDWPVGEIDHINGIRDDNRLVNLRDCKHSENMMNGIIRSNNKSGFKGVSWDEESAKWKAQIYAEKRKINLGRFTCAKEAHEAYCIAAFKYHGEFARTS